MTTDRRKGEGKVTKGLKKGEKDADMRWIVFS
jgi:hypothetical protein